MGADAVARHEAHLQLECVSAQAASWIVAAVQPELDDAPGGSAVKLSIQDACVQASIHATSLADLRASVNNVVRLLDAAHNVATQSA